MAKTENIMIIQKRKKQAVKKRYDDKKKNSINQYKKICGKSNITYQRAKYQKNYKVQLIYKDADIMKILKVK